MEESCRQIPRELQHKLQSSLHRTFIGCKTTSGTYCKLFRSFGGLQNRLLCQSNAPSRWHAYIPLASEGRPINSLLYTYDRPRSVRILTCSCDAGSATRIDHQPLPDQYEHEESPSV